MPSSTNLDATLSAAYEQWGISKDTTEECLRYIKDAKITELQDDLEIIEFLTDCMPESISDFKFKAAVQFAIHIKELNSSMPIQDVSSLVNCAIRNDFESAEELLQTNIKPPKALHNLPAGLTPEENILTATMSTIAETVKSLVNIQAFNVISELDDRDIETIRRTVKEGDIILGGDLRSLSSVFIGGPLTHAMIYVGNEKIVHAFPSGVIEEDIDNILGNYNTMMILRPEGSSPDQMRKVAEYAKKQLGKPYDFYFEDGMDNVYCTELAAAALKNAGIKTSAPRNKGYKSFVGGIFTSDAPHPMDLIGGAVRPVFQSHNLATKDDGTIVSLARNES